MGSAFFNFVNEWLFILIFYATLIVIILTDKFITKKNKKIFITAIFLAILDIVINYIEIKVFTSNPSKIFLREIASYTGYSLRPFLVLCFLYLIIPDKKHRLFCYISILNLILYFTSHYTHLCTYFNENGNFMRGPLWMVVFIICGIGLLILALHSIINSHQQPIQRWILPPICSLLIVFAVICDVETPYDALSIPTFLDQALILVMLLFYLFYHLLLAEHYEEEMIHNQKLQLMISQIKPHFFFNTITTIQALCNIDAKKASDTLAVFANYVRQNLSAQTNQLIPFDQEIQHVKTFVNIEILRFPNIEVQYDLQFTDFDIVTLSIQPLVENAIKHGIRSKEHGSVIISTRLLDNAICITIKDNGIGFDTKIINTLDDTHVGIRNVQNRLKILQNANMEISSNSNGTTITITIPWEN